jgi:hypothetical protein
VLSDEVLVEERGYHVIDLSRELPLVREEDFVVVPGFFYSQEFKREQVVFVVSDERPAELVKTYRASSSDAEGFEEWIDYGEIYENSVLFVQTIMRSLDRAS